MRTTARVSSLTLITLVLAVPVAAQVLYDNGGLLTHPAGGCGGQDLSAAQDTTVGLTSRGFNHSLSGGFRVADDFTVDGLGWQLESIDLYAYQGGSSTTSPITAVNLQIWDGVPNDPGSTVVCGDTTTNRLVSSTWTNMYRAWLSQATTDCSRPLMLDVVGMVGCTLPPGTYWLDWQTDGDVTLTGPWAAPVSVLGQNPAGNALQQVTGAWQAVVDTALLTPLDFPFVIHGTPVSNEIFLDGFESGNTSAWSAVVP